MLGGINLSLLIGAVPVPAPQLVVEALTAVRIDAGSGAGPAGFELAFDLPPRSPLRALFLVGAGGFLPLVRVILVVRIGARAEAVLDGVAINVEAQPGAGGSGRLVVKGKDLGALMDIEEVAGQAYPATTPAMRVALVLAKYAAFGVVPQVIPSAVEDLPLPTDRVPQQFGTDYAYVQQLAEECGHVFYFEPGPLIGTSKAYWGPEIRVGAPQPALAVNMDALSNVEQLDFTFDKERKVLPIVHVQDPASKETRLISVPARLPPLGLAPPQPVRSQRLGDTAQLSAGEGLMAGMAFAARNSDSIQGQGRLDVARYGRLLKPHQLVGVRGAGLPFDGLHYVTSVAHDIKRGAYKQTFSLSRDALLSTVPLVPT